MSASLVGSEMCIRDRWSFSLITSMHQQICAVCIYFAGGAKSGDPGLRKGCLLYTSDAADDM
eukprot:14216356-Alexandrium_andersonii.AAC.1